MRQQDGLYSASFKAAVALAAFRGDHSVDELARRFSVPTSLIQEWTGVLEQNASVVFTEQVADLTSDNEIFDSSELATTIAENSTQGFAMMDRLGYCIYANKAWLNMTGYSVQEISSKPLHDLVHHHHPDGTPYPMEECPIDRALPENFDVRAHEDIFFRKDGSTFDVVCAASPIFKAGKPVATVIEIRDVTVQKQQARERVENEQRALHLAKTAEERRRELDAFLDAAPVGIGMADINGRLIIVNRANREIWGENLHLSQNVEQYQEFKGWWADSMEHHGQPLRPEEWALTRALGGEDVNDDIVEIEPLDKPGTRKTISLSARPIRDDHGTITGAVVAQNDITLQKQAEGALREADRNKDDFIAILAHELRNPLAPIRAAVDLFQMLGSDNPLLKRATDAMARQVEHIIRLVDDLLDVARISRGKVDLKVETCDIAQIVAQIVEDHQPTVKSNGVALQIQRPSYPVWVNGDSARLAQIVGNLLHNAGKFTKPGNRILIQVTEVADATQRLVALSVQDDGAGMAPELVATLFNPFIQAVQGLGRSTGGLGLGLALVKGLADLHGGTVTAHSAGPGLGSTFTVRLPIATVPSSANKTNEEHATLCRLRIVAIDDNKDALDMLSLLLSAQRHEVNLAYDGKNGFEIVRRIKPDVVICDIGLPGEMNGYDVAQAIRGDSGLADTKIIALSGYGQESDKKKSASAGFDAHLVKPVRHRDLENELKKVVLQKVAL